MKKVPVFVLLFLLLHCLPLSAELRTVRVGAFNYYPGIFKDTDGQIKGFYVESLTEIGRREGIKFEYVWGSWSEGLERIKTGEIDMITSAAYTPERAQFLDYCKTPLLTVWGELYVSDDSDIDGITALEGKRIAVMKSDFNAQNFIELADKFHIKVQLIELPSFEDVFKAVASKTADGGIVNCTYGVAKQREYHIRSTGLVFNPFDIFFAVAKGKNQDLLFLLDGYLSSWKHQELSVYNTARQKWSHGSMNAIEIIPQWLTVALTAVLFLLVFFFLFTMILRFQVRRATRTIREREKRLKQSEGELRSYFENSPLGVFVVDNEGRYLDVNPAAVAMTGYSSQELLAMSVQDLQPPETVERDMQNFHELQMTGRINNEFTFRHKNGEVRWWSINGVKLSETKSLGFARDITSRKQTEDKVQSLLHDKTDLLKEVHQRIKNNMITIKGLLYLQAESLSDPQIVSVLNEAENRVQSMIILYDKLYSSENYRELSIREYLSTLTYELIQTFPNRKKVAVVIDIGELSLNVRFLVPLGIIVNELVSNSMKYAFTDRDSGVISITAALVGQTATICVTDDGNGMPENTELGNKNGVGLNLVKMLVRQINGVSEIEHVDGTRFIMHFDIV